jgi:hypothetical protein
MVMGNPVHEETQDEKEKKIPWKECFDFEILRTILIAELQDLNIINTEDEIIESLDFMMHAIEREYRKAIVRRVDGSQVLDVDFDTDVDT